MSKLKVCFFSGSRFLYGKELILLILWRNKFLSLILWLFSDFYGRVKGFEFAMKVFDHFQQN